MTIVRGKYADFELQKAQLACKIQGMIGPPSQHDLKGMVCEELINNCPVSLHDIKTAHTIFGPDHAGLREKKVRQKSEHVDE